jgi:DNA-binding NtrC family response regulator
VTGSEQHSSSPGVGDRPALRIALDGGEVIACNSAAATLLDIDSSGAAGRHWRDLLQLPEPLPALVADALAAGLALETPPVLIAAAGGEAAVTLRLFPDPLEGQGLLLLEPLLTDGTDSLPGPVEPGDTVAVLGVAGLAFDSERGLSDIASFMHNLRSALGQILRQRDRAGAPGGTSIALVLHDTDLVTTGDIARALLSHLEPLLAERPGARVHVGLAHAAKNSPLATLVAANNAMLLGREAGRPVTEAGAGDLARLAAGALATSGVLSRPLGEASADDAGGVALATMQPPPVAELETGIDGYVDDNMEGAIDQAIFLAGVDMPVAIIGPRGTGKLYLARVIHREAGGAPDDFVSIDCRELRGRQSALRHIAAALDGEPGRTLVFKSPQLLHPEVQRKLARQLGSRVLADTDPPRYLPQGHYVGLFPDDLDRLVRHGDLDETLAGVFGGYPIRVPPLRERGRAVLRWAHKILGQESAQRDRPVRGFTRDAEQALLQHDWPGNISELRQAISDALDHTDKAWLTPVDLGLFSKGEAGGTEPAPDRQPFLQAVEREAVVEPAWTPSALEQLSDALAEAVHGLRQLDTLKPLGAWLDDEVVLAACKRYRGDRGKAAAFLGTRSRNIARWMPKIESREEERAASRLWQEPRRLVQQWVSECGAGEEPLQEVAQALLMAQIIRQCDDLKVAARAKIMGVSAPTYHKRLQELEQAGTLQEGP